MEGEILQDIGLSKNETKVYLALLELGASNVGKISAKSGVHRTNIYDSLKSLIKKGIVSYVSKGKTSYFEAINPEGLANILKEKEEKLRSILPSLVSRQSLKEEVVSTYDGVIAFRNLLNALLEKKKPIFAYGIPKEASEIIGKTFLAYFHKKRSTLRIQMKHVYNEDARDRMGYLNRLPYTEAKHLEKEFDTHATTLVCDNVVLIIHWSKSPLTIKITSEEISKIYYKYFNILWKLAKA
ncbi:MAG: helix-turn-helix domain-containing protein [Nanoarchaeota archaeon]